MKTVLAWIGGGVVVIALLCLGAALLTWGIDRFTHGPIVYVPLGVPDDQYRQALQNAGLGPYVPARPVQNAPVGAAPVQQQTQAPLWPQSPTLGQAEEKNCIPRRSFDMAKDQALGLGRSGKSAFEGFLESAGKDHNAWADFHGTPSSRPQISCRTGLCVVYGTTNRTNRPANVRVTPIEGLFERDYNGTDPVDGSGSATFSGTIFPGFTGAYVAICNN